MEDKPDWYIGIDPGLKGAISIVYKHDNTKALVFDCPIKSETIRKKHTSGKNKGKYYDSKRFHFDLEGMKHILAKYATNSYAVLEKSQAMPMQGVVSMWKTGLGQGLWEGLLCGMGIKYELTRPKIWQEQIHDKTITETKEASFTFVADTYPTVSLIPEGCRAPKDGRADAICIATYAKQLFNKKEE